MQSQAQSPEPAPPRARDLGVPFEGLPGPLNAITDVPGVEVGHSTLIEGEWVAPPNGAATAGGPTVSAPAVSGGAVAAPAATRGGAVGGGVVRTGVTAIHPRGREELAAVYAGWYSLNGNGELTGTAWIDEAGVLEGPILITNTHSVGVARDTAVAWLLDRLARQGKPPRWFLPVVGETWDGRLNDTNAFHVKPQHVRAALNDARSGAVAEGNVGGGTGMMCHQFKGGIGTASRIISAGSGHYTVAALVQANHGRRHQLRIAGLPVGLELPLVAGAAKDSPSQPPPGSGSIIMVLATDAPLLPHQLKAVAKRGSLGMARTGGIAELSSGDLMLAFSTANQNAVNSKQNASATVVGSDFLTPIYEAAVQAAEEAIVNTLVAARTMVGFNGNCAEALPHDALRRVLEKYHRLAEANR